LLASHIWKHVRVMRLSINMRLSNPSLSPQERDGMQKFAKWVLDIGEGRIHATSSKNDLHKNWITIPDEFILKPTGLKIPAITEARLFMTISCYHICPYPILPAGQSFAQPMRL